MIKVTEHTRKKLLELQKEKGIMLEGNVLKLMDAGDDEEFKQYLIDAVTKDKETRRKRLDVTKKIQSQNTELAKSQKENIRVNKQLIKALDEADISQKKAIKSRDEAILAKNEAETLRTEAETARKESEIARESSENAKKIAENDLEMIQKKSQFELIGTIVKVALWVIIGVGVSTTVIFITSLLLGLDTTNVFTTWSNIISILLTNSFSIVGTIMGVKYAMDDKKDN